MTFYGRHPYVKRPLGSAKILKVFPTFKDAEDAVKEIKKKYGKENITYRIRVAPAYFLHRGYTAQIAVWVKEKVSRRRKPHKKRRKKRRKSRRKRRTRRR